MWVFSTKNQVIGAFAAVATLVAFVASPGTAQALTSTASGVYAGTCATSDNMTATMEVTVVNGIITNSRVTRTSYKPMGVNWARTTIVNSSPFSMILSGNLQYATTTATQPGLAVNSGTTLTLTFSTGFYSPSITNLHTCKSAVTVK